MKSHHLVRQPGRPRVSVEDTGGCIAFYAYDFRECRLDNFQPDATLCLKHSEYTVTLRAQSLRRLYLSLLVEEVLEVPKSESGAVPLTDAMSLKSRLFPTTSPEHQLMCGGFTGNDDSAKIINPTPHCGAH